MMTQRRLGSVMIVIGEAAKPRGNEVLIGMLGGQVIPIGVGVARTSRRKSLIVQRVDSVLLDTTATGHYRHSRLLETGIV